MSADSSDQGSVTKKEFDNSETPSEVFTPPSDNAALGSARRKFDFIILPVVCLFFLLAFLDRSNVGNAKTLGMQKDLKLTSNQFSLALTATFIPYILIEIPSTIVINKVGPHRLLPLLVTCWGLVTTFHGFVNSYGSLVAVRFLIGLFEGGLIPCLVLYLSTFYRRLDLHTRVAVLFTAPALAGAFSGLLAFGINHLNEKGGQKGWRWIFFLEGGATVILAAASYFVMYADVESAGFLTPEEKLATRQALIEDKTINEEIEPLQLKEIWSVFKEPQLIIMTPAFFANGLTLLGLGFFATAVVNSLGYTPGRSQLMSVPPYACAFVVSVASSIVSDRFKARGFVTMSAGLLMTIGYAMFIGSHQKHIRYASLFFQISGGYVGAPALCAWIANNIMPHFRRGTALSLIMMWCNVAGTVSTWTFNDPPTYIKPATINLTFSIIMIFASGLNMLYLNRQNKLHEAEREEFAKSGNPADEDEQEKRRLGDRHRDFVYTL
ncbi:MFS general substrate transporter [Clavulina sp. PMI_390]|nr:MFS general substrate transporter [Clavulina sp. PMI_390]